jgi:predicted dehydrogenase
VSEGRPRLGIIGAGSYFAHAYLPRLQASTSSFDVRAVSRRDSRARASLAASLGAPGEYADWPDLIRDADIDAVLISTPHNLHGAQVRAALERGLHVLVDKPLCLDAAEAESLVRIAERRSRVLSVAYNYHYWPAFQCARAQVDSNRIGDVRSVACLGTGRGTDSPLLDPSSWMHDPQQAGGGALVIGGTHRVEAVLWLSARRPRTVFARMRGPSSNFDHTSSLVLELDGGAVATVLNEARGPRWQLDISIYGDRGAVFIRDRELRVTDALGRDVDPGTLPAETDALSNFHDAIANGATPLCTARDAYWAVAVVQAAYLSAGDGSPQPVRPIGDIERGGD